MNQSGTELQGSGGEEVVHSPAGAFDERKRFSIDALAFAHGDGQAIDGRRQRFERWSRRVDDP